MKVVRIILVKTLVQTFYRQHAGLLLFVFYLFFGVVHGSELVYYHLSLIRATLSSPVILALVVGLWSLYAWKTAVFCQHQMHKQESVFLMLMENFPLAVKRREFVIVQFYLMLPVLIYASFMIGVGMTDGLYLQTGLIIPALLLLLVVPAHLLSESLNKTRKEFHLPVIRIRSLENFYFVHLRFIFHELSFGLAVSKIISLVIMYAFITGFGIDHYDVRLPMLALLIAALAHSMIVFNLQQFESGSMEFTRNLARTDVQRMLHLLFTYCFLLLPEFILLLRVYIPMNRLQDFLIIILLGTGLLAVPHTMLYRIRQHKDQYPFQIFLFAALCFFFILFHLYLLVLLLFGIIFWWGMKKWYYRYQPYYE